MDPQGSGSVHSPRHWEDNGEPQGCHTCPALGALALQGDPAGPQTAVPSISGSAAWGATGSSSAQTSFLVTSNDSQACIKIFSL